MEAGYGRIWTNKFLWKWIGKPKVEFSEVSLPKWAYILQMSDSGSWTTSLFRATFNSPWTQKKYTYIYNVSNKEPSSNLPINVINSKKYPQQWILNIILYINHYVCDFPNCRNYLMTLIIGNWIEKFQQGSTKEICYHCKYNWLK